MLGKTQSRFFFFNSSVDKIKKHFDGPLHQGALRFFSSGVAPRLSHPSVPPSSLDKRKSPNDCSILKYFSFETKRPKLRSVADDQNKLNEYCGTLQFVSRELAPEPLGSPSVASNSSHSHASTESSKRESSSFSGENRQLHLPAADGKGRRVACHHLFDRKFVPLHSYRTVYGLPSITRFRSACQCCHSFALLFIACPRSQQSAEYSKVLRGQVLAVQMNSFLVVASFKLLTAQPHSAPFRNYFELRAERVSTSFQAATAPCPLAIPKADRGPCWALPSLSSSFTGQATYPPDRRMCGKSGQRHLFRDAVVRLQHVQVELQTSSRFREPSKAECLPLPERTVKTKSFRAANASHRSYAASAKGRRQQGILPQARGAAAIARPLHDRHALLKQQKKRIEQLLQRSSTCCCCPRSSTTAEADPSALRSSLLLPPMHAGVHHAEER